MPQPQVPTARIVGNVSQIRERNGQIVNQVGEKNRVMNFTVAFNPRVKNRATGEYENGEALFFDVAAWDYLADNAAASLKVGDKVVVDGDIILKKGYTSKDGVTYGTSFSIRASSIAHSMEWNTSSQNRRNGGKSGGSASSASSSASSPSSSSDGLDEFDLSGFGSEDLGF